MSRVPSLLLASRRHRRISQADLARLAGMPRSVVNVYERGRRDPGAAALERLLRAADMELAAAPRIPLPDPVRAGRILEQVLDLAEALPTRRRAASVSPVVREVLDRR